LKDKVFKEDIVNAKMENDLKAVGVEIKKNTIF